MSGRCHTHTRKHTYSDLGDIGGCSEGIYNVVQWDIRCEGGVVGHCDGLGHLFVPSFFVAVYF